MKIGDKQKIYWK